MNIKPNAKIQISHHNRLFFAGDLHGQLDALKRSLDAVNFNYSKDRLVTVGDMVDCGTDSVGVLELLNEPWFYSVIGNHEQLFLSSSINHHYAKMHRAVGGHWATALSVTKKTELANLIKRNVPQTLTIETPEGQIGVSHALPPMCWMGLVMEIQVGDTDPDEMSYLTWGGAPNLDDRARRDTTISYTVHGHYPTTTLPSVKNNHIWLPTKPAGHVKLCEHKELYELVTKDFTFLVG